MTSTGRVAPNEGWPNVGCETEAVSKGRTNENRSSEQRKRTSEDRSSEQTRRTNEDRSSEQTKRTSEDRSSEQTRRTNEDRSSEQTKKTDECRSSEPITDMAAKGRIHSGPVTQVAVVRLEGDPSALLTHPPGHAHAVCGCLHCMRVSRPEEYQDPIGTHGDGIATAVRL
jgi:archaellum component FlaD/FlaE